MSDYTSPSEIDTFISEKIRLVVRQQQEGKTFIAIEDVLMKIKQDSLIIILTMNTIKSQMQFFSRLREKVRNKITVFNSKDILKELDEQEEKSVEHISRFDKVMEKINKNEIRILFMCSNGTRINQLKTLIETLDNTDQRKAKISSVYIYQDEAHQYLKPENKRGFMTEIIKKDIVKELNLYSATPSKITLKDDPIWGQIYMVNVSEMYKITEGKYFSIKDCNHIEITVSDEQLEKQNISEKIPEQVTEQLEMKSNSIWYRNKYPFLLGNEHRLLSFYSHCLDHIEIPNNKWSYNFIPAYMRKATHYMIKNIILAKIKNATVIIFNGDSKLSLYRNDCTPIIEHELKDMEPSVQIEKIIRKHKLENSPCFITGFLLVSMSVTLISETLGNFDNSFIEHSHFPTDDLVQLGRFAFNYTNWSNENQSKIKKTNIYYYNHEVIEKCVVHYEHIEILKQKPSGLINHSELQHTNESKDNKEINPDEQRRDIIKKELEKYTSVNVLREHVYENCIPSDKDKWEKIYRDYEQHTKIDKISSKSKPKLNNNGFYECSLSGKCTEQSSKDVKDFLKNLSKLSMIMLTKNKYKYARIYVGYDDVYDSKEYTIFLRTITIEENETTKKLLEEYIDLGKKICDSKKEKKDSDDDSENETDEEKTEKKNIEQVERKVDYGTDEKMREAEQAERHVKQPTKSEITGSKIQECNIMNGSTHISTSTTYASVLKNIWSSMSKEEFKKHTRHNIQEGKVVDKGFRYFQVHNVSIQGKDAISTYKEIVDLIKVNKYTGFIKIILSTGTETTINF
jgi:hypothetical protein